MPYQYILSTLLLATFLPFAADATPIDCTQAGKATEHAICANEGLRELDERLDYAFRRLRQALPDEAAASAVAEQKGWLHRRNRCNEDSDCLERSYSERIKFLHDRWRTTVAYQPDEIDLDAMAQLREAIELKRQTDPEFPLEKALETFSVKREMTTMKLFGNNPAYDPKRKPKGVSKGEWRAFVASATHNRDIMPWISLYAWLDIDGDMRRDLILKYVGSGTGLCDSVGVVRQTESGFNNNELKEALELFPPQDGVDRPLFTTCARGRNQNAEWIKINGRVYAAYRDGHHGVDEISLLNPNPSKINVTTPRIGIRYGYNLKVERNAQTPKSLSLKPIDSALRKLEDGALRTPKPICPIPKGTPQEMRGLYEMFGTSLDYHEVVADFPIWIGKQCYIARLGGDFGRYYKDIGMVAYLLLRRPEEDQDKAIAYNLTGRRYIKSIETGLAKFGE